MPEQYQVPEPFEEESEVLSPEEIAILTFTNHGEIHRDSFKDIGRLIVLTGKQSYYWAVALALAYQRYPHVDEKLVFNAYKRAISFNYETIRTHYSSISFDNLNEEAIFVNLLKRFFYEIDCPAIEISEVIEKTELAFSKLVRLQLIEDPIEIAAGTLFIAALGFIPFGFTTKTRRGRVVYRKISAGYWTFERKKIKKEEVTTFNFRLVRFISAFKKALVEITQESIDDPEQ